MTFFATQRTRLSIQKYTLANMGLEIAFTGLVVFAGAVAKGALRAKKFDCPSAFTHDTFLITQTS